MSTDTPQHPTNVDRDAGGADDIARTSRHLLNLLEQLLKELHAGREHRRVTLDSILDRDLGLDSLARTELMLRMERHFNVSLPDELLVAESARDLLRMLLAARGRTLEAGTQIQMERSASDSDWPRDAATLQEVLAWHVASHPERIHCRIAGDDDAVETMTYRDLYEGATHVAASLQAAGLLPGGPVALMLPTGREYLLCFMGTLLAGGIPIPIYPPLRPSQLEEHMRRHVRILDSARVQLMITVREAVRFAQLLKPHVQSLLRIVVPEDLLQGATFVPPSQAVAQDIALLQYTSGSTGQPKGVIVTHANMLANLRGAIGRLEATPDDVFVSWLPLYHDMGLIGAWLGSLYVGCEVVLMSPLRFLGRPSRWLAAIHQYRGTLSASPNFGYELCLRKIADEELRNVDLSSWRVAMNGAEPVSPVTLDGFVRRFSRFGLQTGAVSPVYGLAESTVALAMPTPGRGLVVDRIQRDTFRRTGRAESAAEDDPNALVFVDCGHVLAGHQLRVVAGNGQEVGDREEGRLQFQGPSATGGYYRNAQASAALYDGEWLDTGDRAYIADGQLFVTGRDKEMIIRGGRNIHPYELEQAAGDIEGIRKGCVAVLGARDAARETEQLIVIAETTERDTQRLDAMRQLIGNAAKSLFAIEPDDVVFVPPRTVLKTSSGKIRRTAMRDLYQEGALHKPQRGIRMQLLRMSLSAALSWVRRGASGAMRRLYGAGVLMLTGLAAVIGAGALVILPGAELRWRALHRIARLLFTAAGIRVTVRGTEHMYREDRPIFVANHTSYVDSLVLVSVLPRPVRFVGKLELRSVPFLGWLLERAGLVFVDRSQRQRSGSDANRLAEHAAAGQTLMIFPEGTFQRQPGLLPFRMGAFRAAAEARRPVVPIVLRGTRRVLLEGTRLPRRYGVAVTFLAPHRARGEAWEDAVALSRDVRKAMLQVCGEPDRDDERA